MRLHLLILLLLFYFCTFAQTSYPTIAPNKLGAGNSFTLDGEKQYVNCGNIKELKGTSAFTLEAWVKIKNYRLFGTIFCNQAEKPNERIHLALSGYEQGGVSNIIFVVGDDGINNANYNTTSNPIKIGKWIHIAAVFDGTQVEDTNKIKIYVNGQQQYNLNYAGSGKVPSITSYNTAPFLIGMRDNHGLLFDGQIDEVRIWNIVRSKSEIREHMHLSLKGTEKGLVAYYQFDENDGDIADAVHSYNATPAHKATREFSDLLLGKGLSKTLFITQKGNYSFGAADCSLYFPYTSPNGEVTVTKIEGKVNDEIDGEVILSNNLYDKNYWLIHNYGYNQNVKYQATFNIEKDIISKSDELHPTDILLNYKPEQAISRWGVTRGIRAISKSGIITFDTLQEFGTFVISSNGSSKLEADKSTVNLTWLLVFIFLLVLTIGIILYISYKRRQKISRELAAEKKITEIQTGEKLVLIHEIHHRVKNNLTMLKSLLYLQARAAKQPETKQILKESQARIQSMALVHKSLYDGDNVAKLDFTVFIKNLLNEISITYFSNEKTLEIQVNGNCDAMDASLATPLALVMNELATNSFKYAFVDVEEASIIVDIQQKENNLTIQYSDNGPGLPEGQDLDKGGFGFKMLNILTQQIDANISYQREAGASTFLIEMKLE